MTFKKLFTTKCNPRWWEFVAGVLAVYFPRFVGLESYYWMVMGPITIFLIRIIRIINKATD